MGVLMPTMTNWTFRELLAAMMEHWSLEWFVEPQLRQRTFAIHSSYQRWFWDFQEAKWSMGVGP
jgi:hypothetical protein